jgi:hypothetical protein
MSGIIPIPKDNASAQLSAGINASSLSIVLGAGEGASLPQPINGSATSLGSSILLNCTGIQALGVAVGDFIYNLTDSTPATDTWSMAVVTAVSADSVSTTPLSGGSDNIWQSSDDWVVDPFVINLSVRTGGVLTGAVTQYEKVLITDRSTDTISLPVASGYRGFDGTTPNSFSADDFVTVEVDQSIPDGLRIALATAFRNFLFRGGELPMTAPLAMGANAITGVEDPTDDQDAATKKWVTDNFVGAEVADDVLRIVGSADGTKKLAFEVDGITTETTRTLTAQDKDYIVADDADIPKKIQSGSRVSAYNGSSTGNATVTSYSEYKDTLGDFNATTGIYTCPEDGDYLIHFGGNPPAISAEVESHSLTLKKNTSTTIQVISISGGTQDAISASIGRTIILPLVATDTLQIDADSDGSFSSCIMTIQRLP